MVANLLDHKLPITPNTENVLQSSVGKKMAIGTFTHSS